MSEQRRDHAPAAGRGPGFGRGPGGFRAGMPVEKAKDFKGSIKRLIAYLGPRKYQIIAVFFLSLTGNTFAIMSPKVMGRAITELARGITEKVQGVPGAAVDFGAIRQVLLTLVMLYTISAVFTYIKEIVMASIAQRTVLDMRRDISEKLARLPLKFFDSRTHGEILSRVTNDVDNISTTLQQSLTQLMTAVITIVGSIFMMLTISPTLTLICLVTLPLYALVTSAVAKRSQAYFKEQQKTLGELNGHVEEMYTGHKVVKAFGQERASIERFKEINGKLYGVAWRAQFISGIIMPLMTLVNNIGYVFVCVMGGLLAARQRLALGDIQAFIQYSRQFTQPILQTANIANVLQSTVASAERVFELLDEQEEVPDRADAVELSVARGEVRFQGVDFGYEEDAPILEDMNIDVRPGQSVAIVGPTGAGKTTLVNLLMRFYDVSAGKITVDGVDIRDMKRRHLRSKFGMVLQDTWLFNGTIRDNIAYGRPGASEEDIVRAAQAAHADHFIRTLPEGYDTVLNEEASNISQGQKQLLTIARALLADPAILILDEATSSVDTRTELLIQQAMTTLMKGRTSFVIAHRLSTIREADLILVMNNGQIIEQGTHKELLARAGFYADLYNSQFVANTSRPAEAV